MSDGCLSGCDVICYQKISDISGTYIIGCLFINRNDQRRDPENIGIGE